MYTLPTLYTVCWPSRSIEALNIGDMIQVGMKATSLAPVLALALACSIFFYSYLYNARSLARLCFLPPSYHSMPLYHALTCGEPCAFVRFVLVVEAS